MHTPFFPVLEINAVAADRVALAAAVVHGKTSTANTALYWVVDSCGGPYAVTSTPDQAMAWIEEQHPVSGYWVMPAPGNDGPVAHAVIKQAMAHLAPTLAFVAKAYADARSVNQGNYASYKGINALKEAVPQGWDLIIDPDGSIHVTECASGAWETLYQGDETWNPETEPANWLYWTGACYSMFTGTCSKQAALAWIEKVNDWAAAQGHPREAALSGGYKYFQDLLYNLERLFKL